MTSDPSLHATLGELLRRWRQSHRLSQAGFGTLLSPKARASTVSCWEKGIRRPSARFLGQIVALTGIPAHFALGVPEVDRPMTTMHPHSTLAVAVRPPAHLRKEIPVSTERRIPLVLLFLTLALTLTTGCTTAARLARPWSQAGSALFTSATFSDLKLTGIKTGPAIPVQAEPAGSPLDEATLQAISQIRRQGPVGLLLPVTKVGETTPWWIFCPAGEMQTECEAIPVNARVNFSGQPLGHGMVLLPSRLTWTAQ